MDAKRLDRESRRRLASAAGCLLLAVAIIGAIAMVRHQHNLANDDVNPRHLKGGPSLEVGTRVLAIELAAVCVAGGAVGAAIAVFADVQRAGRLSLMVLCVVIAPFAVALILP